MWNLQNLPSSPHLTHVGPTVHGMEVDTWDSYVGCCIPSKLTLFPNRALSVQTGAFSLQSGGAIATQSGLGKGEALSSPQIQQPGKKKGVKHAVRS